MKRHSRNLALGTAAAVAMAAASQAAHAQSASLGGGLPDDTAIEEVVVTAQRRAESLQDVPAAISALTGESLEERGITKANDLQFLVPSMQSGKMLGDTAIAIRGVGLNVGSPGVAIHVDGVYQPRPSMGDLTQIDLARVEVLRGPQGTLYGRNANGGVVNFITQAPTSEREGYLLGSYASFDESRLQGLINLPLSDRFQARLVVDHWNRGEGFVKNVVPGNPDIEKGRATSGRLRLAAQITDTFKADLSLTGYTASGPTGYYTLTSAPSAASVAENPFLAGVLVPTGPRETAANGPVNTDRDFGQATATLTWDLGSAQLKSITAYSVLKDHVLNDEDSLDIDAFPAEGRSRARTFSQELNASATIGHVEGVVGAFYMRDTNSSFYGYVFPLGINGLPVPGSQLTFEARPSTAKTLAVFTDITARVSDRLRILGGIRFSRDDITLVQRNSYSWGPTALESLCSVTASTKFDSTTPRLGVQYDVSDDSNLYATYSKGFKAGGFSGGGCDEAYNPEKLTSYEFGWKNRLAGGSAMLNVTAFYYDYTNLQLSQTIGLASFIANAAKAEVKGVEVEALWRPLRGLTLNGNASFLDARFSEFVNTDSLNLPAGVQSVDGNYLNNAPRFSMNLGASYETDPVLFDGPLTLRVDVSYRTRVYFREFNAREDSQDPYAIVNASVTWRSPDENYSVRVFGTNLTGQEYYAAMNASSNFGARYASWGMPRQVGIEVRRDF